MDDFTKAIAPFFWVDHEESKSFSVCLNPGDYKPEIFHSRADEGFEGGGYDWASLATVFLSEKMPELEDTVDVDPEASMFVAYSKDSEALKKFILAFKEAYEDEALIQDLFSRAELD
jgi:hypothetical protein